MEAVDPLKYGVSFVAPVRSAGEPKSFQPNTCLKATEPWLQKQSAQLCFGLG